MNGYPFPGVVGQEMAKKALLCALVHSDIHSVLIKGNPGTAKSTLVRSIESVDQDRKILTIPHNITLDRLVGMVDLEGTIRSGMITSSPGMLEQGDGHILYVDDCNLMDEAIISTILSAVDTGFFSLEREALSQVIASQFLFLATMDPEEGALTSGQMDRFDLCVSLDPIENEEQRAAIIKNAFLFEQNPVEAISRFMPEVRTLQILVGKARERLPYVSILSGLDDLVSAICDELHVSGHRGDIAVSRTAKALAALDERDEVNFEDIRLAALFALQHRRNDTDPNAPQTAPKPDLSSKQPGPPDNTDREYHSSSQDPQNKPDFSHNKNESTKSPPPSPREEIFDIGSPSDVIRFLNEKSISVTKKQKSGRRTRIISQDKTGHYQSFRLPVRNRNDIAIDATLRAAAPYQRFRRRNGVAISVCREDIREKIREKKIAHTILFLVDASGSMGVRRRMVAVKGAILALLTDAYQKRDRVGLMTFRGNGADLLLPPTRSTEIAVRMLRTIPTGGMTPLGIGLFEAYELLNRGMYAGAGENKTIILLTDGRANVAIHDGSPYEELDEITKKIADTHIRFVVVDTEQGFPRLGRARMLAEDLRASYVQLDELGNRGLAGSVHRLLDTTG